MRPAFVVAAAVAAGTLFTPAVPLPAGAASAAASSCEEPEPTRSYDDDSLDYRLALDLSGCDWWEGGQIELTASLTRSSILDDATTVTNRLCGVAPQPARPARPADDDGEAADDDGDAAYEQDEADEGDEDERDPRYERARIAKCVIDAQLEHPSVETAMYSGEIAYPWEDGTRTVSFSALCTSGLGRRCTDLP